MTAVRRVLLIVVLLLAGVPSRAEAAAPPAIEEVPSAISKLLDDYSRAWREKDLDLLEATVSTDLIASERRAMENASAVPFTHLAIRPSTQFSGDLASDRIDQRYSRPALAYHVVEESRIGAETSTYVDNGVFTFIDLEQSDAYDGWRLASKRDLDLLGFFSPHHLWDEKPVVVLRSDRFILLTHPDVADVMRPVLSLAERAYDKADRFWPGRQRDRYVIIAPSTTEELGRIMHETIDLSKFVAFVAAGADQREGWKPTGPRMFIHLSHLRNYSAGAQTEIVAHELIHAVTRPASGPHIPTWVEEGLANLGGGSGGRPSVARQAPVGDEFPSNDRFVTGPVRGIQAMYDQSQVAIEVLVDEFGTEGLSKFYAELGSERVAPGTEEYHVRRAVAESVGWSYEKWVSAWRERLR